MQLRLVVGTLVVLAAGTPAAGQTGPLARYGGGGRVATDCMIVTDVAGATGRRAARCTDGDPTCDGDGVADGACRFAVRLCLDAVDPAIPRCQADVVTEAAVNEPTLAGALAALATPVATPETCTAVVSVPVARRGRRGRLLLQGSVRMASGHADRDRVALVCRRPPPPITFATLQKSVFGASCASFSCHGVARAGGLSLAVGEAYANLVGVPASNAAAQDAGLLRVAAGNPAGSFLLRKLDGTLAAGEGEQMPRVGTSLDAASIARVRRWIAAGAPETAPF